MAHVFLTGEIGIGKSSLIEQIIAPLDIKKIGGFRTVSLESLAPNTFASVHIIAPAIIGCNILPMNEQTTKEYNQRNCVGLRKKTPPIDCFPQVFDDYGCRLLAANPSARLILMDELGMMEDTALAFQAAVLAQLEQDTPILGVVKQRSSHFLDKVKSHPRVVLLEVRRDNRDSLLPQISTLLNIQD